jgi:hypothetical protein
LVLDLLGRDGFVSLCLWSARGCCAQKEIIQAGKSRAKWRNEVVEFMYGNARQQVAIAFLEDPQTPQ